ncbi:hypothetical protein MTR67_043332 [Solanum verrucosum]|uniref:Uncharacterized protein n=1 Tax=Solanum verrucosum TaxID=315347 RepID=A0AAF0UPG6_SOLVR|nr:hypothetical protein MTR67_043332 [Solanum verrucosum]
MFFSLFEPNCPCFH